MTEKLKIFTWYLHRGHPNYFSKGNNEIYASVRWEKKRGYKGIRKACLFTGELYELLPGPASNREFDSNSFQNRPNDSSYQFDLLKEEQKVSTEIHIKHSPFSGHPANNYLGPDIMLYMATDNEKTGYMPSYSLHKVKKRDILFNTPAFNNTGNYQKATIIKELNIQRSAQDEERVVNRVVNKSTFNNAYIHN